MARSVTITGTITRVIDSREVAIPFYIDVENGTYSQWGHSTPVLGENVDLLESLRDAATDAD